MTIGELFGWVETLLKAIGVWTTLTSAITIIVVVSLGAYALSVLRR